MDGEDAGPPAVRRRRAGPDQPHAVALARRGQPGVPRGHLPAGEGRLRRAGPRAARRRLRHAAGRDDLRHPQRQGRPGRHRGGVRVARHAGADPDLGDHHRSQRPHALRADGGGLLGLDRPRAAVRGGHQLRAGRARDAPVPRGPRPRRHHACQRVPERRAAERVRPVRRDPRRDRRPAAGIRPGGPRGRGRRLLRDHTRPYPGDRGRGGGHRAARRADGGRSPASRRGRTPATPASRCSRSGRTATSR